MGKVKSNKFRKRKTYRGGTSIGLKAAEEEGNGFTIKGTNNKGEEFETRCNTKITSPTGINPVKNQATDVTPPPRPSDDKTLFDISKTIILKGFEILKNTEYTENERKEKLSSLLETISDEINNSTDKDTVSQEEKDLMNEKIKTLFLKFNTIYNNNKENSRIVDFESDISTTNTLNELEALMTEKEKLFVNRGGYKRTKKRRNKRRKSRKSGRKRR